MVYKASRGITRRKDRGRARGSEVVQGTAGVKRRSPPSEPRGEAPEWRRKGKVGMSGEESGCENERSGNERGNEQLERNHPDLERGALRRHIALRSWCAD